MIKFDKPNNLNGEQLIQEIREVGIEINDKTSPMIDGESLFWLDIAAKDQKIVANIVENHIGKIDAADNKIAKNAILQKLGITEDEAKLLLF